MIDDRIQRARVQVRFARNLVELRRRAGFSQQAAADRAGLHRAAIHLLETRRRMPRLGTILRVAGATGSEPWELMEGLAWNLHREPGPWDPAGVAFEAPWEDRPLSETLSPARRFGLLLTRRRLRAGLRPIQLAEIAGAHRVEVNTYERGRREPRLDTLLRLAAAVESAPAELLSGMRWTPGFRLIGGCYELRRDPAAGGVLR